MINMYKTALLVSAISVAIFTQTNAFAASETIGVNSAVKGDVTIQSGEQEAKQAVIKAPVLLGDVVNSNKVGSLQVLLKDQTMFTVGPDCNLTIDKFVYDPAKASNSMSASVKKGMFRFMSGNISKSGPDSVAVTTPVASMGVRGTMVEGLIGQEAIDFALNAGVITTSTIVDPLGASLFVLRGPGRKSTAKNKRGEIAVTSAGETVVVRKSGMAVFVADVNSPPTQPFQLTQTDTDIFHDKLRTAPSGGVSYRPFDLDPSLIKKSADQNDRDTVEFSNPETGMDWPTEFIDADGNIQVCTPSNPHFPNCP